MKRLVPMCMPVLWLAGFVALAHAEAAAELKTNWQNVWRQNRHDCERDRRKLFSTKSGKPLERRIGDLPRLMAEEMVDQKTPSKAAKTKKKEPSKPKGKLSKKERLKQELAAQVGGGHFDDLTAKAEAEERAGELEAYERQTEQILGQIFKRARLRPTDSVSLSEFCDLMWRGGNASPLDEDDPMPRRRDDDDEEEEEGEESDSLGSKIEL